MKMFEGTLDEEEEGPEARVLTLCQVCRILTVGSFVGDTVWTFEDGLTKIASVSC